MAQMVATDVYLEITSLGDRYDPRSRTQISFQNTFLHPSLSRYHLGTEASSLAKQPSIPTVHFIRYDACFRH